MRCVVGNRFENGWRAERLRTRSESIEFRHAEAFFRGVTESAGTGGQVFVEIIIHSGRFVSSLMAVCSIYSHA